MFYYPDIKLPGNINDSKLQSIDHKCYKITMLYSSEGIFQVKNAKLWSVFYLDDDNNNTITKTTIDNIDYVTDKSDIKFKISNKIPYEFTRRDLNITEYSKGSVTLYIERTIGDDKVTNLYFNIKNQNIYGIHDDIKELMRKVLKASFSK